MKQFAFMQRFLPAGALGISLLLHLAVFLGISGVILIQAVAPKVPFIAADAQPGQPSDLPPPPDLPDDPQPEAPATEQVAPEEPTPQLNLQQIVSAVSTNTPEFVIPASPAMFSATRSDAKADGGETAAKPAKNFDSIRGGMANPFGSVEAQGDPAALTGYMYDFKQTSGRVKTNISWMDYRATILKYVREGWNDGVLRKFYKAPVPLATYQIFIPTIKADIAPAAFNAEKYVEPRLWMIVYKGSFISPVTGTYRFVGKCDDVMVVRVGDRDVLDGSLYYQLDHPPNQYHFPREPMFGNGGLYGGEWMQLEAGKSYPLQVIIGEQPGGVFYAWLLIQKKGSEELAVFQMAKTSLPKDYVPGKTFPPVAKKAFVCRAPGGGED